MAHVLAFDHVDHVLRYVLGVIAHPFQRLGDEYDVQGRGYSARILDHVGEQLAQDRAEGIVHFQIAARDFRRRSRVEAGKAVQRLAQHVDSDRGHALDFGIARHVAAPAAEKLARHQHDLFRFVADALQVGDGLHHHGQHAQIDRGRRPARDDVGAQLVDLHLQRVHLMFHLEHLLDHEHFAAVQRPHRERQLILDRAAHVQDFGAHLLQLCIELRRDMVVLHALTIESIRWSFRCRDASKPT